MDTSKISNEHIHDNLPFSSKSVDKIIDDSQHSGELLLSGRKLSDFPNSITHYDLSDLHHADLSKNCLSDFPRFLFNFLSLEHLNCYHNSIKTIPISILQLKNLVQLNLSHNQLTCLPKHACQLACLQILNLSNNRLQNLPNDISQLNQLMELDVSNNQLQSLPDTIQQLTLLRYLDVHKNYLTSLNSCVCTMRLVKLDISVNHITHLPADFDQLTSLDLLIIHNNPLIYPPPNVVMKGCQHIMSYIKMDRSRTKKKNNTEDASRRLKKGISTTNVRTKSTVDEDSPSTLNASDNIDDTQLCNLDDRSISQYETLPKSRVRARERVDSSGRTGRSHYNYYNKTLYKTGSRLLRNEINFLKVDNRNNNNVTVEGEEETLQRTFKHSVSVGDLTTKPSSSSPSLSSLPSLPPPLSLSSLVMNNATLGKMKSTAPNPSASSSHLKISSPGHPLMPKHSVQPKVFADDGTVDDDGAATDEENSGSSASPSSVKTLKYQDNTDHDEDGGAGRAAADIRQLSSSALSLSDGEVAVGGSRSAPGIESSSHFFDIGFIVNDGGDTPENLTPTADHHNRRRIPSKVDEEKEEYFDVYEKMHKQRLKEASKIKKTLDVSPNGQVVEELKEPNDSDCSALSPRLKMMLDMMSKELKDQDPVLTIRRNLQQVVQRHSHVHSLKQIIETILKIKLPCKTLERDEDDDDDEESKELGEALRDGSLLCQLANALIPKSISNFYTPTNYKKLSEAKCRKNVEKFLLVCQKICQGEVQSSSPFSTPPSSSSLPSTTSSSFHSWVEAVLGMEVEKIFFLVTSLLRAYLSLNYQFESTSSSSLMSAASTTTSTTTSMMNGSSRPTVCRFNKINNTLKNNGDNDHHDNDHHNHHSHHNPTFQDHVIACSCITIFIITCVALYICPLPYV